MKTFILSVLASTCLLASTHTFTINEIASLLADGESDELTEMTVNVQPGKFSFEFEAAGDVFETTGKGNQIKIKEPFFVRILGEDIQFSNDEETWRDFDDFFTGQVGFSLKETSDGTKLMLNFNISKR